MRATSGIGAPGGAALGLLADAVLGDPPDRWHPVAWFGSLMERVEGLVWSRSRGRGVAHAGIGLGVGVAAGRFVGSTSVATALAAGGRSLEREARAVVAALDAGRLDEARGRLPALVGRDPAALDEGGVVRAVVESVAENTVDAVVAPGWWAACGGASAVAAHRAVNTMDAVVGHRSERHREYGWAAARLDDVANWAPARLTALLVAAARPRRARRVGIAVRRDAPLHASPNAGVAESAFAAALGVSLGGSSTYAGRIEERPLLGDGPPPVRADVDAALVLLRDVRALLIAGLGAWAVADARRSR